MSILYGHGGRRIIIIRRRRKVIIMCANELRNDAVVDLVFGYIVIYMFLSFIVVNVDVQSVLYFIRESFKIYISMNVIY